MCKVGHLNVYEKGYDTVMQALKDAPRPVSQWRSAATAVNSATADFKLYLDLYLADFSSHTNRLFPTDVQVAITFGIPSGGEATQPTVVEEGTPPAAAAAAKSEAEPKWEAGTVVDIEVRITWFCESHC